MKQIVVFGAGMVAGAPYVEYLLGQPDFEVTVASRTVAKAEALVKGHPHGHAVQVNSDNPAALEALIKKSDLAVSLLPYAYHPVVATLCLKHRVHMVTTSYVKEAMAKLDAPAREAGIVLLNEIGLDPGIDHMSAIRVIHRVQAGAGRSRSSSAGAAGFPRRRPTPIRVVTSSRGAPRRPVGGKNSAHSCGMARPSDRWR